MVRKISLVLALILCLLTTSVSANGFLDALGILPASYGNVDENEIIPYDSFLYMTAKMLSANEFSPQKTRFSDVDETNEFSGYIEQLAGMGIIKDEGKLYPDNGVSANKAAQIMMRALGYNKADEGVLLEAAFFAKIFNDVELKDGMLTYHGAVQMVENTLNAETVNGSFISTVIGESLYNYGNSGETLLIKSKGLTSYSGVITDINTSRHAVEFLVQKDLNKEAGELAEGNKVTLSCDRRINIGQMKYAPVTVWINEDDEIVFASLKKNVQIKFGVIASVNGHKDKSAWYTGSAIEEISILDDGIYDVSVDADFYMDEKTALSPEQWIGKVARFVVYNNEIISVESWNLAEGGLITEVTSEHISYIKGDMNLRLNTISEKEELYVYIDGTHREFSEIKPNSVFSFYEEENKIVIVVSEGVVSDNMETISANKVTIGGFIYNSPDTYFKSMGGAYVKGKTEGAKLLGQTVKGYIGPDGNIAYLEGLGESDTGVYLAVILGSKEGGPLDEECFELKMLILSPNIEKGIYKVTEKTTFEGDVAPDDIKSNKATAKRADVFEVSIKGSEIKSIKPATWFKGYGERAETSITSFVNQGVAMQSVNGKMIFFKNARIVMLYEDSNGEMAAQQMPWTQLQGRNCTATMGFFCYSGNEFTSVPDMVMVNGSGVKDIANSTTAKYGILTGKSITVNENGEEMVYLHVNNGIREQQLMINAETAKKLPERAYIIYRDGLKLSNDEISIASYKKLVGAPENWETAVSGAAEGLFKGTVERVDELRLFYKDESGESDVDFYHPSFNFFVTYNTDKPQNPFSAASYTDIQPGDTVYFYNTGEGLKGVIIIK